MIVLVSPTFQKSPRLLPQMKLRGLVNGYAAGLGTTEVVILGKAGRLVWADLTRGSVPLWAVDVGGVVDPSRTGGSVGLAPPRG